MKSRSSAAAFWTLIGSQLITGATYIVAKEGLRQIPPLAFGSLLFLPVGVPSVIAFDRSRVTPLGVGSLLYLALMTSVLGYLVWSWALSISP